MAGAAPLLIEWQGAPHPAGRMASTGHRLDRLAVSCPDPDPLAAWCARHLADPRIGFQAGPPGLSARLVGPQGAVSLR
jgi:hypothetical protein